MLCPNCEAENRDAAKFCDECGFPLASVAGRDEVAPARDEDVPAPDDDASTPDEEVTPPDEDVPAPDEDVPAPDEDVPAPDEDVPDEVEEDVEIEELLYEEEAAVSWSPDITMEMPRIASDQPAQSRDFLMTETKKKQRPKLGKGAARAILIAVLVVAVAACVVAATYFAGIWGGKFVPDVTGMTEADARSVLVDDGFEVRSTQVKSDDTEGLVLLMDPGAGSRAEEGSEIVIHVAAARFIPDLIGKASDEAVALLDEAGYENVQIELEKSDDEEGIVLVVSPEAGTRARSNTEVTLTVSEGYYVPDITGMQIEEAREAIREEGLEPRAIYVDNNEYPEGTLIGTDPEAGTKVSEGDTVTIHMARPRGAELEGLTKELLAPGKSITVGGNSYVVETLGWVSYQGNDTVAYSITARPYITFFGETLYTSSVQTLTGSVVWSSDNNLISIS